MSDFDDETLMAFADGVLDPETSEAVERALASDPELGARVAALAEARVAVRDLHRPLLDLPVPEALAARITEMAALAELDRAGQGPGDQNRAENSHGNVVDLASRRSAGARFARIKPFALAASLAALIAGPIGYLVADRARAPAAISIASEPPPSVSAFLDTAPSGRREAVASIGTAEVIASFRDGAGNLCREFQVDGGSALLAVACRSDATWRIAFAIEARPIDGYAPAGSLEVLDAWLAAASAGDPLSAGEEAMALGKI